MTVKTLTARSVATIRPSNARREIADAYLPGLYLIIQPSGAKSWAVRYRHRGRTRKHTLGACPAIDLATARQLGAKALRAVADGRDPGYEKTKRPVQADSVEAIVTEFVALHCRRENKPQSAAETERLLRKHVLPRWRGRTVHSITRRDVIDLLDTITVAVSSATAASVFAAVRRCFAWCLERDILAASPCQGVKRPAGPPARDRVLSDPELALVWRAAEALGGPFGGLVHLLILTAARRNEVAHMRWEELDLNARSWTLPPERTKNARRHVLPLSDTAMDILESMLRIQGSPYVLTTSGTPVGDYAKNKRRIDALLPSDMPGWRLHDARRTAASGMARLGVSLPVIERCLNHVSGSFAGIVGVYQRHDFAAEMKAAFDAWGQHVTTVVSDGNVVAIAPEKRTRRA